VPWRTRTNEDLVKAVMADGVSDARLLSALRGVPRTAFVPIELARRAYADEPLPIPHEQVTTQPSLVARMVEALDLRGDEQVLEVGTGYGFQTALLSRLARSVWSIERFPDIAETARALLARNGARNVEVVVGDGSLGLEEHAPFDAILVSAAFPSVPEPLADQLAHRGRLVQPIGSGGDEDVMLFVRERESVVPRRIVTAARFVRLYGSRGFPS
jgi:protein-L-isoaspartate(D-aspartate) O-methyltransferase